MAMTDNLSLMDDGDQILEYYEEVDDHTLDFQKRKRGASKSLTTTARESSEKVNPLDKLNEQLNRQFRPDLVPPTPSPLPTSSESYFALPVVPRTPTPNPIIYDARAKPVKSPKQKKEPEISVKQKLLTRIHQLTAPDPEPISYTSEMPDQQTTTDGYQVSPGMVLVAAPQQQQQQQQRQQQQHQQKQQPRIPMNTKPSQKSQPYPIAAQYQPPTVTYNNSLKSNRVAPPPPPLVHQQLPVHQVLPHNFVQRTSSSMISTNPLIPSNHVLHKQSYNPTEQSKPYQSKSKKQMVTKPMDAHRSFALYNQQNGRIEGVVKNRLNVADDDADGTRIIDDEIKPKNKWALWLSQPLCLGLKRLSGGLLFGCMIILGTASVAGLIASIVTYIQNSTVDSQWKILGMVVCAIMIITIIVTLIVFICCFKYGYMFNKDDDIDPNDPSATLDADGNERQKAVLRKIYKFNRPNETSSVPSGMVQDVSTTASISHAPIQVNDKQTNTETTIAPIRPKDLDRGVWPSMNAYGGISYRPLIQPQMVSRFIQVLPHDIEQTVQAPQIIYQFVAEPATEPQPRIIQIPNRQPSFVEVIEKQPRMIEIPTQQTSFVEVIETQRKQPRTIQLPVQESPVMEVIETIHNQPRTTLIRQPQSQQIVVQPTTRIEYIDIEEHRPRRMMQQPQYEYVEEIIGRSSSSSIEEFVEIVDAPRHLRKQERRKGKRQPAGIVSVKHIKSTGDEPYFTMKS